MDERLISPFVHSNFLSTNSQTLLSTNMRSFSKLLKSISNSSPRSTSPEGSQKAESFRQNPNEKVVILSPVVNQYRKALPAAPSFEANPHPPPTGPLPPIPSPATKKSISNRSSPNENWWATTVHQETRIELSDSEWLEWEIAEMEFDSQLGIWLRDLDVLSTEMSEKKMINVV